MGSHSDMLAKILAQEEGERLAVEVVQEIVKKAGNIVYEHYIQRKVVPYAVQQTKEKILELIKLYFFEYDQGEGDISNKPEWNIDPEPQRVPIDTWARRAIPVIPKDSIKWIPAVTEETLVQLQVEPATQSQPPRISTAIRTASKLRSRRSPQRKRPTREDSTTQQQPDSLPTLNPAKASAGSSSASPIRRYLPPPSERSRVAASIEEKRKKKQPKEIDEEQLELMKLEKLKQELRGREYTYDSNGDIIFVQPIDPDKLPVNKINVRVSVKESKDEESLPKITTGRTFKARPIKTA